VSPARKGGGSTEQELYVWTDGGARGNPGPAGIGAVVTRPDGTVLAEISEGIGWATNNVAEYRAVIAGLERAKALGGRRVRVRADSLLLVQQLRGAWKVRNAGLQPLRDEALRLVGGFDRVVFEHVPRSRNRAADKLANQAMDAQGHLDAPAGEGRRPNGGAAATRRPSGEPGGPVQQRFGPF
jgi:ribonuclease H / adenosylcobalamin/alpha-ribazole phosphatase